MVKQIVGGVIVLVIGGTGFAVSKSDIINNFSKNSGMSQQQAQQYVNNIKPSDLESFSTLGQSLVSDGNSILSQASSLDCVNYTYQWVTSTLSCSDGENQLQSVGNDEITLGNCYQALGTNLGNAAKSKTNECIYDIDTVDSDYNFPIVTTLLDNTTITNLENANNYNKSVLESALDSQ
jgi:hypothetical protein